MSNIECIVVSLEDKIKKVLLKLEDLKATNSKLNQELEVSKRVIESKQLKITNLEEKYENLKIVNSMLGSEDSKRETKLKINALIRDIDHCISQLSS